MPICSQGPPADEECTLQEARFARFETELFLECPPKANEPPEKFRVVVRQRYMASQRGPLSATVPENTEPHSLLMHREGAPARVATVIASQRC